MRIIQALPTIAFGDAVSNDALSIYRYLESRNYLTEIYAENISEKIPYGTVRRIDRMPYLQDEDILLYHASTGTELNRLISNYGGKLVVRYHNVTPPEFMMGYSTESYYKCLQGWREISALSRFADYAIADSEYNRQDMVRMGYRCDIDVIPILIPWEDYEQPDDPEIIRKYRNGHTRNLLFTGRIVPNKKQENVIRAFYAYTQNYNPDARLFLCGNDREFLNYRRHLENYAAELGIGDKVVFTGQISFRALLTYYKIADLFLCMSEHEGFCVPIVESMYFGVPVAAYRSSAIAETLGRGGILLETRSAEEAAAAVNRVLTDQELAKYIREEQRKELSRYQYSAVAEKLDHFMNAVRSQPNKSRREYVR